MTKDEMIAALAADHGIDVQALLAQSDTGAELAALSNALGEDNLSLTDVAEAVLELSAKNDEQESLIQALVDERNALRLSAAEDEIDGLVKAGRILPKQRDRMLQLSMNDRETFEDLLPDSSLVSLSEEGVTTFQSSNSQSADSEIARLIALASGNPESK